MAAAPGATGGAARTFGPKSPAGAAGTPAARPATASPKKLVSAAGKSAASPAAGAAGVAKKAPPSPASAVKAAAPAAGGAVGAKSLPPRPATASPAKTAVGAKTLAKAPVAAPGGAVGTKSPTPAPAASPAAAPAGSTGKKFFKRPVTAGATTAVPAAASPTSPMLGEISVSPASGIVSPTHSGLSTSLTQPPQQMLPRGSVDNSAAAAAASVPRTPVDGALIVNPAGAPSQISGGGAPLDQVIARNQEAAAALAILLSRQTEQDHQKLAVANEKIEALQKLLVEREAENKTKIDSLEKQLAFLVTAHTSCKRENELLKDVLSDRDGPKMVQRLEQLEDENKKTKQEAAKLKEMVDYHREKHLKAMEDLERAKEGLPIGPTQSDWESAQQTISRLSREHADLTLKVGDLEDRLSTVQAQKSEIVAQSRELAALQQTREMIAAEQQRLGSVVGGEADNAATNDNMAGADGLNATAYAVQSVLGIPSLASPSPARGGGMYGEMSVPPGMGGMGKRGYSQQQQIGYSAASPSPFTNNAKFNGFAGNPLRGTVNPASATAAAGGSGGTRGWRALMLPNGNVVYHNMISNRSQWEVPAELLGANAASGGLREVSPMSAAANSNFSGMNVSARGFL